MDKLVNLLKTLAKEDDVLTNGLIDAVSELYSWREEEFYRTPIKFALDEGAIMPQKAHSTDAGFDLYAIRDYKATFQPVLIETGVHVILPRHYAGQIVPRSSASKAGQLVHTGTIDEDYRGSLKICATLNQDIMRGDRIAQLVVYRVAQVIQEQISIKELLADSTGRSVNGFGSTGR